MPERTTTNPGKKRERKRTLLKALKTRNMAI